LRNAEPCFNNQTDQGDKTEGLEREVLQMEGLEREVVKILFFV
jgi:hypothetical protein